MPATEFPIALSLGFGPVRNYRVPSRTFAYWVKQEELMKVPEMILGERVPSGTSAYRHVPSRTSERFY